MSKPNLDQVGNQILSSFDLLEAISNDNILNISNALFENQDEVLLYNKTVSDLKLDYDILKHYQDQPTLVNFDADNQANWFMPDEYKNLDIVNWVRSKIPPWDEKCLRVEEELQEFQSRNMINLLKWLKYFVDTCQEHNIFYGVGRGSSVASYVLYIIGVHSIDSVKYDLDYKEFFK